MTRSLALALACSALTSCDTAHGATKLELRLEAGQSNSIEMILAQEIVQTMDGAEQRTDQEFVYGMTQTVRSLGADGVLEIGLVYDWVRVTQDMAGMTLEFDSRVEADEPDPRTAAFRAFVGQGFQLRVTPSGEIVAVEGVAEMLQSVFDALDLPPEAAPMRQAFEKQFGDDALREMMQPFLSIYPGREVDVGDSWEREHRVTTAFPHVQKNRYELLSREGGVCTLDVNSEVSSEEGGSVVDLGMMQMRVALSGTQTGTITLEEGTGVVQTSYLESQLEGEMSLVDGPTEPWPVSLRQAMSLRRVE